MRIFSLDCFVPRNDGKILFLLNTASVLLMFGCINKDVTVIARSVATKQSSIIYKAIFEDDVLKINHILK